MVDVVVAVEGRGGGKDRLYWSPVLVGEGLGEKPNAREEMQQCRCKATRKTSRYMRSAGTRLAVSPTPGCCQCGCTGHVDSHIMWVTACSSESVSPLSGSADQPVDSATRRHFRPQLLFINCLICGGWYRLLCAVGHCMAVLNPASEYLRPENIAIESTFQL
ncbi:hypothetical protein SCLCIDRAFT_926030 [Scleroderma citrinum Foug A]|uniref:Uncharacterized protein n=1 Tax=Scleroderma citrinum Foug A TaxID=1036808 RepID=A0A0C3A7U2_9AGAM|nr:hypothetical protein SCLCIDRAFT_926030 [Scleroderma citrinum Foug A]